MELQPGNNRIRVLSDPVVENQEFNGEPVTRFSWKVYDYATNQVRVLSKSAMFLRKFDFFSEAWGDAMPMKCDIIIGREGNGLKTRYEFAAVPVKDEMVPDWQSQADSIDFKKLKPGAFSIDEYGADNAAPAIPDKIAPVDESKPIDLNDIPF